MTKRLEITFTPGEGAVLRMLGLVERRGFLVRSIAMKESGEGAVLAVDAEPRDSNRHVDVLARQLARLVDVRTVTISTTHAGQPA